MITQSIADAFALFMSMKFHVVIIRKDFVPFIRWFGAGLDIVRSLGFNVPSGEEFIYQYATTIGLVVLIPPGLTPQQQVEVLTHECQHAHQFLHGGLDKIPGDVRSWWLYLVEPEARARLEAEAYTAGLEVSHWLTGKLPPLEQLTWPLEGGYALGPEHVQLARDLIEQNATAIDAGLATTEAGRTAIAWLEAHAPELKGAL